MSQKVEKSRAVDRFLRAVGNYKPTDRTRFAMEAINKKVYINWSGYLEIINARLAAAESEVNRLKKQRDRNLQVFKKVKGYAVAYRDENKILKAENARLMEDLNKVTEPDPTPPTPTTQYRRAHRPR